MKKGLFISIEGGEGTGKTTMVELLTKRFRTEGIEVVNTREPGGIKTAEAIRNNIFEFDLDEKTDLLLYLAARREHLLHKIYPALESGKMVISDRFYLSTLAYQGYASNIDIEVVKMLNSFVCDKWLPDLNILIDLEPEIGLGRKGDDVNRFDLKGLNFHKKVYQGYKEMAKDPTYNIKIVDGRLSINELENQMYNIIQNFM
ncbi:MAG: dTMP kinase [Candidatus Epulonipiscioides saccharophilum]|nr:MAG: dTMP kinase [Epulopiscium sp. AS2M-Bin001]